VDWIDPTERGLILKFFEVDPVPAAKHTPLIGFSTFRNIIDFYRFEFKDREKEFWDVAYPKSLSYEDVILPLVMTRVSENWMDYVTEVDISYKIVDKVLVLKTSFSELKHLKLLQLICYMLFVSDFKEMKELHKDISTEEAWNSIIKELESI